MTLKEGPDVKSEWTTVEMRLSESSPLPDKPLEIVRFLCTSLAFMTKLCEVSVYFDDHPLAHIVKKALSPTKLELPSGFQTMSPKELMVVNGIESAGMWVCARPETDHFPLIIHCRCSNRGHNRTIHFSNGPRYRRS